MGDEGGEEDEEDEGSEEDEEGVEVRGLHVDCSRHFNRGLLCLLFGMQGRVF